MRLFDSTYFNEISIQARQNKRSRQHENLHSTFDEPCQRLFNAIELNSYIPPHRHYSDPRDETLIAIRGFAAVLIFDERGDILNILPFGTEKYEKANISVIEIQPSEWHTVISLDSNTVILEVKAGPFDPTRPKDLAPFAPAENSKDAKEYHEFLLQKVWSSL